MRRIAGTVWCTLVLIWTAAGSVETSTKTATSCGANDVQAALNLAAAGDTAFIPAGTCHGRPAFRWTAPANVTLQGAGNLLVVGGGDGTVIIDDYAYSTRRC